MLLGWHRNSSWPHRKESLGQASLLMWTQGWWKPAKDRTSLEEVGTLQTRSLQLQAAGPHVQTQRLLQSAHG